MANFTNPFSSNVDRRMSTAELVRAIRLDIAAEHEAVCLYEAHADACADPVAAKILRDIANEEKVHVHELQTVLHILDSDESKALKEGATEVEKLINNRGNN